MEIHSPCVAGLTWQIFDSLNEAVATLDEPVEFFVGGDDLLPTIEAALQGLTVGNEVTLSLEPEQAFGEYDSALVCFENRALFPDHLEVGMQFEGLPEGASTADMPQQTIYTVTEIYPEQVVLDGNHPLAGILLRVHLKVCSVREAYESEVGQGTVNEHSVQVLSPAASTTRMH